VFDQSILAHERMLSLPVQAKDSVDVIGFVDVLDVLTHIVRLCSEGKTHPEADEAFEYDLLTPPTHSSTCIPSIPDSLAPPQEYHHDVPEGLQLCQHPSERHYRYYDDYSNHDYVWFQ
jgi:hypothetical protein